MAGSSAARRIRTPRDGDTLAALRAAISEATLRPEEEALEELRTGLQPVQTKLAIAKARAIRWVEAARRDKRSRPFAESLMERFPLDSAQGRALMSLAEALLRTPDAKRADQLIAERLAEVRRGVRGAETDSGTSPAAGGAGAGPSADTNGNTAKADRAAENYLLRLGFALLGGVSRLLPDVAGELAGSFSPASLTNLCWPRWSGQHYDVRCGSWVRHSS